LRGLLLDGTGQRVREAAAEQSHDDHRADRKCSHWQLARRRGGNGLLSVLRLQILRRAELRLRLLVLLLVRVGAVRRRLFTHVGRRLPRCWVLV